MHGETNQKILSLLQLISTLESWNRNFYSFRHFIFTKVSGYGNMNENNASSTICIYLHVLLLKELIEILQKLSCHMLMQTHLKEKLTKSV